MNSMAKIRDSINDRFCRLGSQMIRVGDPWCVRLLSARADSSILLRHPEVEITALTTRKTESPSIGEVHPSLAGRLDLKLENLSADASRQPGRLRVLLLAARSERVGRRRAVAARQKGHRPQRRLSAQERRRIRRVVRPSNTPIRGRLTEAVYGLPEIYRERIQTCVSSSLTPAAIRRRQSSPCAAAASRRDPAARNHRR